MLRLARAALFAAVGAEVLLVVLVASGVSLPGAVLATAETLALAVLGLETVTVLRLYRAARRDGLSRRGAARAAYERLVPVQVRRIMGFDVRGMVSVALWLARRRHGVPPGAVPVPYFSAQAPALLVFLGAMVVELFVVEVVLRSLGAPVAVRTVLVVLDAYAILVALAVIASCVTRPHVVSAAEVRVRSGAFFDLRIPRDRVAAVRRIRGHAERGTVRVADDVLTVAVSSQANLLLELTAPVTAVRPLGATCEVRTVRCFADDPVAALDAFTRTAPARDGAPERTV
ncbi:hypothetical protein Daura_39635 [Dactylosporangium aurantiacum]|uniref:Uncharacterized protein n=1 Tax=Dactylosporangium aurantiacum TaxID=35754 RepID=A0A9Q9IE75_9ACTN|nr:hypothetical protein [Dactylosporangium aurantiacum]MDG6101464.1 hypothetical protein [Dactylosporangium aurantiacum]UWZ52685.1 hypothetical protein Daura_39635 [Dactylosporangium aurantiacum]